MGKQTKPGLLGIEETSWLAKDFNVFIDEDVVSYRHSFLEKRIASLKECSKLLKW